jgi:hypothetical protein
MLDKKIRRYKLMDIHREFVRSGKLFEAREILWLLRKGRTTLGLSDEAYEVERVCEDLGCNMRYGRNFNTVEVRL